MYLKEKVVVGMSGGVDSSLAAYLLKKKGYEVIGVTLKHLGDQDSEGGKSKTCCSLDDIYDAKMACDKIGVPHYVINAVEPFEREVVEYFVEEYSCGLTPSPCVICDEKIKIKKLLEIADKMEAGYISTGHYCDVAYSKELGSNLLKYDEENPKDQTYMLYRLGEETLRRMVFPLKGFEKQRVREMAKELEISVHNKKDSQGICFAPEGYKEFLKKKLKNGIKPGNFVDKAGNILGKHEGYQLYTVGQRRGLGINLPKVYFITNIVPERNEICLGDFDELMKGEVELVDCRFLVDIKRLAGVDLIGRPRFSSKGLLGMLEEREGHIFFVYHEKNAQNSPGQHMVIYSEDLVVGGGKILF